MKTLLNIRIPSICICFTLITLGDRIFCLIKGVSKSPGLLLLFLWLAACQLIDSLLSGINFKTWGRYCAAESVILYVLSLAFSRMFFWDSFTLSSLLPFTAIFLVTAAFIFWYFRKRQNMQAEEINELLDRAQK